MTTEDTPPGGDTGSLLERRAAAVDFSDALVRRSLQQGLAMAMNKMGALSWSTTIENVAREAGVSSKTIYDRIGNKDTYVAATYEYAWREVAGRVKDVSYGFSGPGREHLWAIFDDLVRTIDDEDLSVVVEFLITVERRNLEELFAVRPDAEKRFWAHLESTAERAIEDRTVVDDRSPARLVRLLWLDFVAVYMAAAFRRDGMKIPQSDIASSQLQTRFGETLGDNLP